MARTAVATRSATAAGTAAAFVAATADGQIVDVGKGHTLVVVNGSGVSTTVTVQTPMQVEGIDVAEVALVVPAGQVGVLALDPALYKRRVAPDYGKAYVNAAPQTSVTIGVIQR